MDEEVLMNILRRGLQNGTVPVELTDASVDHLLTEESLELSDPVRLSIQKKLKLRLQDAALRASSESLLEPAAPLGRLILMIRTRAGVSRADVCERIGKTEDYIQQIENDASAIPNATAEDFVDLMQVFHLTLSRITETIGRMAGSLLGNAFPLLNPITTGLQSDKGNRTWRESAVPNIPAAMKESAELWLQNVQTELRKKNKSDLLR